jgi:hypothetical protein
VQLQTASNTPLTAATPYDMTLLASGPRNFRTDSFEKSAAIAPARKNAGIRQKSTCNDMYSKTAVMPTFINVIPRSVRLSIILPHFKCY